MRRRPFLPGVWLTHPQDNVGADQAGEEHDFGDEKQPNSQLAVGERQAHVERDRAIGRGMVIGGCFGGLLGVGREFWA